MKRIDFNDEWIFWSAEHPEERTKVRLPHDAMQTEGRIPRLTDGALVGFFPGGDYYYEKRVNGTTEEADQSLILEFGGIFMDSKVYLNGELLGGHVYGYAGFYVDLTGKWKIGENRITVFVHNSQIPNSRWYSGSGIYRPVYLWKGNREHIIPDGVRIITKSVDPAKLEIQAEHTGPEDAQLQADILWNGEVAASGMQPIIPDAKLWDDLHPNLYTCRIRLVRNGDTLDEMTETFGIRSISVDAENGLLINGKTKKLIGGCLHHTNGILGAFDNKAAALHTVKVLKDAGFNAVRGAHNPRSKEFLEACDELGMYVMDEFFDGWFTSGTYGYPMYFDEMWREDLTLSVRKAFNHPSVIMYSIGNEVSETAKEKGLTIAKAMTELTHELDATRPVTMGVNLMMNTMQHML